MTTKAIRIKPQSEKKRRQIIRWTFAMGAALSLAPAAMYVPENEIRDEVAAALR